MKKISILTPLELKVMNVLWKINKGFVNDILEHWDDANDDVPVEDEEKRPAYNTISTIVRILKDKKKFVGHQSYGRSHEYFPLITKEDYQREFLDNAINHVFSGSFSSLVSTFVDNDQLSNDELEQLKRLIEEKTK